MAKAGNPKENLFARGDKLMSAGKPNRAVRLYEKFVWNRDRQDPEQSLDIEFLERIATIYTALGNYTMAEAALTDALRLSAEDPAQKEEVLGQQAVMFAKRDGIKIPTARPAPNVRPLDQHRMTA